MYDKIEKGVLESIKLLRTKGWIKYYSMGDKGYCLAGAISYSVPDAYADKLITAIRIEVAEAIGIHHFELSRWNDKWYRTKLHVLWVLYKTLWRIRVKKAKTTLV